MQTTIDPGMQGRVCSLTGSLATAMSPFGLVLAGPLSDRFGIQIWFIIGGFVTLLMGIFGLVNSSVRNIEQGRQAGTV